MYLRVQGADSLSKDIPRHDRNLTFRDDIYQGAAQLEWSFYFNPDVGNNLKYTTQFNAYLFAGVSVFHFDPYGYVGHAVPIAVTNSAGTVTQTAIVEGGWYKLSHNADAGVAYKLVQPGIPLGIGFYYGLNKRLRLGWNISWTKTFTHYIDDAGQKYPAHLNGGTDNNNPDQKYFSDPTEYNGVIYVPGVTQAMANNYGSSPANVDGIRGGKNDDSFISTTIDIGYTIGARSHAWKGSRGTATYNGSHLGQNFREQASFYLNNNTDKMNHKIGGINKGYYKARSTF